MSDELERLRQEKLRQLMQKQQSQQQEAAEQQMKAAEIDAQIKHIINRILTPEARERLANIRISRPAFARQIELFLIQLYQSGKMPSQLSDEQLKKILARISEQKRETKIKRI